MFHWPEVTLPLRNLRSMKLVLLLFYIQVCNTSAFETECYFKYISQVYETLSLWIIPPLVTPTSLSMAFIHPMVWQPVCTEPPVTPASLSITFIHPMVQRPVHTGQGLFESNQSKYTHSETVLVLFNRLAICCGKVVISRRWHQLWITTSLKTSLTATLALNWRQMKATRLT